MDYENSVFDPGVCDTSDLTNSSVFLNAREKQPLLHVYACILKGEMIQSSLNIQKLLNAWE